MAAYLSDWYPPCSEVAHKFARTAQQTAHSLFYTRIPHSLQLITLVKGRSRERKRVLQRITCAKQVAVHVRATKGVGVQRFGHIVGHGIEDAQGFLLRLSARWEQQGAQPERQCHLRMVAILCYRNGPPLSVDGAGDLLKLMVRVKHETSLRPLPSPGHKVAYN
eukprot:scaffold1170_cov19-Tisochrysis_lutea.AAC.1